MRIERMPLEGAAVVQSDPFRDRRGLFVRYFCLQELAALLGARTIHQVNLSTNLRRGTIRGLHFQHPPHADMKLVRCLRGETHHVIVDMRERSTTFLRWCAVRLSARAMNMLCVPEGFAHGFQSLHENCELMYLVTSPYAADHQGGLRYDDPALAIPWPLEVTEISDRDTRHALLATANQGEAV